ncbi:MAG TPA: phosphoribosylanthranilate isomerase, partial [Roseiflexaceae bacterium]|nr:phosphoribosylanthranilate isomerase [Roseiflexaceae bacterium]
MTIVKICGLRTADHALAALHAGADFLGFIMAPSRRQIAPAELQAISAAVRAAPGGRQIGLVGVFVNETPAQMREIAQMCELDVLQLSGDDGIAVLAELPPTLTVVKALRLTG